VPEPLGAASHGAAINETETETKNGSKKNTPHSLQVVVSHLTINRTAPGFVAGKSSVCGDNANWRDSDVYSVA